MVAVMPTITSNALPVVSESTLEGNVMKKMILKKIFLQYPKEGEIGPYGNPVHKDNAEKFVAIDRPSGGYPCPVDIEYAYNFRTEEEAIRYSGKDNFKVRHITVTYEVK